MQGLVPRTGAAAPAVRRQMVAASELLASPPHRDTVVQSLNFKVTQLQKQTLT